ncbi:MAG: ImmA/IrrE family metallo-endopeptidase, partial [Gemmatimonadota bacterium]
RDRAQKDPAELRSRFKRYDEWERGAAKPTLKQLEAFARAVWVPVGYLFLPQPPVEEVPLPDFRSGRRRTGRPSPHLLDTVYLSQARQEWYRAYAREAREPAKAFVGCVTMADDVEGTAADIQDTLGFDLVARRRSPSWTDALRQFIQQGDAVGLLVMISGVVHNNTHRKLDPEEFRGFTMADDLAPLIFVNGADSKAAQMFTLAHELAHVWLGRSALSDPDPGETADADIERWCNQVAAEVLVPMEVLRGDLRLDAEPATEMRRIARRFKVSTLVALRRMFEAKAIDRRTFHQEYETEVARIVALPKGTGGDFYRTQPVRAGRRFVAALVESTLEGRTLYRDALRMLGISKVETFHELGRSVHAMA